MAKQSINVLKSFFETGDRPTQQQFEDLIDSFLHKDSGTAVSNITEDAQAQTVTFDFSNGSSITINSPVDFNINQVNGLIDALADKVDKEAGKSLTTNDYSNAEKSKVDNHETHVNDAGAHVSVSDRTNWDGKVDSEPGKGLSTNDYTDREKSDVNTIGGLQADIGNKVDKIAGKGLSTNDYDNSEKAKVDENSENKQVLVIDATGDFTLLDSHFRTTFFINTTNTVNITIPSTGLRDNFLCFFIVIGVGKLNILVDGNGATLEAPEGTLLSQGKRGMVEKQLTDNIYNASGEWEA